MTTRLVHRPARSSQPVSALADYPVERPPALPEGDSGARSLLMLVPLLGAGASMTVMMLFRGSSLAAVGALMMVVTILASVVMMFSQRGKTVRARRLQRDRYLAYLENSRSTLAEAESNLRSTARELHPQAAGLLELTRTAQRLWEQRRGDPDFLVTRVGSGLIATRRFALGGEDSPLADTDDFMTAELDNVQRRFGRSDDMPVTVPLANVGVVSVVGDRDFVKQAARALVSMVCTRAAPEDALLAVVTGEDRRDEWDWAQWLPHLADQSRPTASGPVRRFYRDTAELHRAWAPELDRRANTAAEGRRNLTAAGDPTRHARYLAVIDEHGSPSSELSSQDPELSLADLGITTVHLVARQVDEPESVDLRIRQESGSRFRLEPVTVGSGAEAGRGVLDPFSEAEAEALARELAPPRLSADSLEHDAGRRSLKFTDLMGVPDPVHYDPEETWGKRSATTFLRVPIGIDDAGNPVMLDLKEAAQFGMGPHGLCVGATGSGKSELLRTLILGLLATHGPEDLNMVLVDYKGGASFAPFEQAPQVSGVITNLSDDVSLVERVYTSLNGEVQRRQKVLRDAGNLPDITAYRTRRESAPEDGLEPLPHLVVVIDEFGELLTARPDFIELFLSIGRIGRSIGVHLLLSSQRIEGGKLRGLDTYLSYRIGMRTLSEAESRSVLDTPDAFALPPVPGYAYLKVDTTTYARFRAGFVSGELPSVMPAEEVPVDLPRPLRLPRYAVEVTDEGEPVRSTRVEAPRPDGPTVLSTIVDRLRDRPRITAPVWLPPLPDVLTLDSVLGHVEPTRDGLRARAPGGLRVLVGRVDDPAAQRQMPWIVDLGAAGGHVLVLGAPGSGKTTFLRTFITSLALTRGPAEFVVYGLDLLGANLHGLAELPIVSGVGSRTDRDVVRRTVEEVQNLVAEREQLMQRHGVDSMDGLRQLAAQGDRPELMSTSLAEVVLVIDGFGQLSSEFDSLEDSVANLVRRASGFGVHVVATATRWNEVRLAMQSFFGNRVELRLADPGESAHGRKVSETISAERPGRAIVAGGLFAHVALPRIDGVASSDDVAAALRQLVSSVSAHAPERAAPVRLLPHEVTPDLVEQPARSGLVPLGLSEADLASVTLDLLGADRHLLAIGDPGTGRTNLLRLLASTLVAQLSEDELVIAVVDPRRTMVDVVPDEYLGGYASSAALASRLVAAIVPELEKRVAAASESASAQEGPNIVLLVDDYDVLTAGGNAPLAPLLPFIAMGHELGLSVVLTRRTAGASRGVFDPVMSAVREAGGTGLLFSGDRAEGQLLGSVRPRALPVGRAQLVRTGAPVTVVQTVHCRESDASGGGSE